MSAVDDGGDFVVGTHAQEVIGELRIAGDVDGVHGIRQTDFLQHNGNLAAVGRAPSV